MPEFSEGKFVYSFPEGWEAIKWDETAFHRKTFQSFGGSAKAVDFVVFDPNGDALWLIECKDFRPDGRKKTIDLCDEMAEKFKATLAGLVCARNADDDVPTKRFSSMALKKSRLRFAVHWEHPPCPRRLWPPTTRQSAMRDKLRQRLRAGDSRSELGNSRQIESWTGWTIREMG